MSVIPASSVRDCFGVEYAIIRMPTNGMCGYHSLAFALTGNCYTHNEVIEDLLAAFFANPSLFVLQAEFGKKNPNLSHYQREMRKAAANVRKYNLPNLYWMEDGHILTSVSYTHLTLPTIYSV